MGPLEPKKRRLRGTLSAGLLVATVATLLWACLQPPLSLLGGQQDGGADGGTSSDDGGAPAILGLFTIGGCAELTFPEPAGEPRCVGTAPLKARLILLAVGATSHRFQVTRATALPDGGTSSDGGDANDGGAADDGGTLDGGALPDGGDSLLDEASSRADTPTVTLNTPGTYLVSLGVAGPGGTSIAAGVIIVQPALLGAACASDDQCDSGLHCLCGHDDKTGKCPGGLAIGMCTQSCDGTACPTGSVCLDLSRSIPAMTDGGVADDGWRQPICVPACTADSGCRGDLTCRELPVLIGSQHAGGAYSWGRGCFIDTPGGVGASCITSDEKPDPASCVLGQCEALGLRNLCTAPCDGGATCPMSAACATWNGAAAPAPSGPRCLARCDATHPCGDPLFDCLLPGSSGTLGFKLPAGEPTGTTVCAPRRCTLPTDCPGGQCVASGGSSFCVR